MDEEPQGWLPQGLCTCSPLCQEGSSPDTHSSPTPVKGLSAYVTFSERPYLSTLTLLYSAS